ncbi:MAG: hypothetical protein ACYTDX_05870 [Planctomycetota bacterium]|jgi:hypothetical protein
MRTATVLALALLASAAIAQDPDPDPVPPENRPTWGLRPAPDKGADKNWPAVKQVTAPKDLEALTPAGRLAYTVLVRATRFTDTAVGIAGITPLEVEAMRALHGEKAAGKAFLSLCRNGTTAGKLWGLCGLWYFDNARFHRQKSAVLRDHGKEKVATMRGCIVSEEVVRTIIHAPKGSKAVVLKDRSDTCKAWVQRNPKNTPATYDIAGGGWPCVFRSGGGW